MNRARGVEYIYTLECRREYTYARGYRSFLPNIHVPLSRAYTRGAREIDRKDNMILNVNRVYIYLHIHTV